MLAFKSDVSHWRQKKEMVGVSVRWALFKISCRYTYLMFQRYQDGMNILSIIFKVLWMLTGSAQIITNVFVQIIILLYLIDNNENTSWMILFGSGTGVLIEAWKVHHLSRTLPHNHVNSNHAQVTKAVDISVISAPAGSLLPYKLDIKGTYLLGYILLLLTRLSI